MVRFLGMLALAAACFADTPGALRGKLVQPADKDPVVQAGTGTVALEADDDTWKVLRDERLNNADVELLGQAKDSTHSGERHPYAPRIRTSGRQAIVRHLLVRDAISVCSFPVNAGAAKNIPISTCAKLDE